jgi:hypothetical protein
MDRSQVPGTYATVDVECCSRHGVCEHLRDGRADLVDGR